MDYTVELTSQSIDKWRNQDRDTLANKNSTDTHIQSRTSTESPVAVLIDARGCSFIGEQEWAEIRKPGNFLSILSNISCSYVVNNMSTVNERGIPNTPFHFLNGLTQFGKMTSEMAEHTEFRINTDNFNPC